MMGIRHSASISTASAGARLSRLHPLDAGEQFALANAEKSRRHVSAHREIMAEGRPVVEPSIVLAGWACRTRLFSDGRRQILSLLLPGDLIGFCRQSHPLASTGVMAVTDVTLCPAPRPEPGQQGLAEAYARSGASEEFYLFRQIARLGRLNAYERVVDLLLEIRDRLALVGLGAADGFPMPLTQEAMADTLGLTSVHVNRTLQTLRREGLLDLRSGVAMLKDADRLIRMIDYRPAIVSAGQSH